MGNGLAMLAFPQKKVGEIILGFYVVGLEFNGLLKEFETLGVTLVRRSRDWWQ